MARYQVTIHDHVIYDYWVEADSKEEAKELAEISIQEEQSSAWSIDNMAGWTEIGDIYLDDEPI
jgi:hypothetical protein